MKRIITALLSFCVYASTVLSVSGQVAVVYRTVPPQLITANLLASYNLTEGWNQATYNRANNPQYTANLLGIPEQSFSTFSGASTPSWSLGGGGSITEGYAANPIDSAMTATRYVVTAGTRFLAQAIVIPAGTYTFSLYAKSNTGVSQTARLGCQASFPVSSSDFTITTSWSRLTFTTTLANPTSEVYFPRTDTGGNALDIIIYGPQLEVGSSATAYQPANGDAQLGLNRYAEASDPAWITAGLDYSGGIKAVLSQLESASTVSAITIYVVAKWPIGGSPAVAPLLNEHYDTNRLGLSAVQSSTTPVFVFSGTQLISQAAQFHDGNWHVLVGTYDGSKQRIFIDNMEVANGAASLSAIDIRQFILGNIPGSFIFPWPGQIGAAAIYGVGHTTNQIIQNVTALQGQMACRGVVMNDAITSRFLVSEGDSITDFNGFGAGGHFYLTARGTPEVVQGRDFAISGSKIQGASAGLNLIDRAAAIDALYNSNRKANIISVLIGANDLDGVLTWSQYVANLKAYCLARKAVGWKIVVVMVLPHTTAGNAHFDTDRTNAIAAILADNSFWDAVARTDQNLDIGCGTCWQNTTWYSDGIHPTLAAQSIIAGYVITAIQSIY